MPARPPSSARPRLLITAGPTHEPIDAVRYLGNRSSGRLGIALANAAAARGWDVTLLLGPTPRHPEDSRIRTRRFLTTADLQALLREEAPGCDILIMAAAVADYRPVLRPDDAAGPAAGAPKTGGKKAPERRGSPAPGPGAALTEKIPRNGSRLILELQPTPDLLAEVAASRRPGQVIVGFALEPRERMLDSARAKLERKRIDFIVANPLETMDAETIEAHLIGRGGEMESTDAPITKDAFAEWLLDRLPLAAPARARSKGAVVPGPPR